MKPHCATSAVPLTMAVRIVNPTMSTFILKAILVHVLSNQNIDKSLFVCFFSACFLVIPWLNLPGQRKTIGKTDLDGWYSLDLLPCHQNKLSVTCLETKKKKQSASAVGLQLFLLSPWMAITSMMSSWSDNMSSFVLMKSNFLQLNINTGVVYQTWVEGPTIAFVLPSVYTADQGHLRYSTSVPVQKPAQGIFVRMWGQTLRVNKEGDVHLGPGYPFVVNLWPCHASIPSLCPWVIGLWCW